MKICSICLKNNFLCNACNKKLQSGDISKTDIEICRALFQMDTAGSFIRAFDTSGYVVIIADKKNAGLLIGRAGRNAKKLVSALGKNVRIIEHVNDERKLIENVISSPILGINKIYGNKELYKIRIENRFKNRVSGLSNLVGKVIEKNVKFVFE